MYMMRATLTPSLINRMTASIPASIEVAFLFECLLGAQKIAKGVIDYDTQVNESVGYLMTQPIIDNEGNQLIYDFGLDPTEQDEGLLIVDHSQRDEFLEFHYHLEELYGEVVTGMHNDQSFMEALSNYVLDNNFIFSWQMIENVGDLLIFA